MKWLWAEVGYAASRASLDPGPHQSHWVRCRACGKMIDHEAGRHLPDGQPAGPAELLLSGDEPATAPTSPRRAGSRGRATRARAVAVRVPRARREIGAAARVPRPCRIVNDESPARTAGSRYASGRAQYAPRNPSTQSRGTGTDSIVTWVRAEQRRITRRSEGTAGGRARNSGSSRARARTLPRTRRTSAAPHVTRHRARTRRVRPARSLQWCSVSTAIVASSNANREQRLRARLPDGAAPLARWASITREFERDHAPIGRFVRACARADVEDGPAPPSAATSRAAMRASGRRFAPAYPLPIVSYSVMSRWPPWGFRSGAPSRFAHAPAWCRTSRGTRGRTTRPS